MASLVRIVVFMIAAFAGITVSYADGSKDMYPLGVKGNRAFLISRTARTSNVLFNSAAHYVYARAGETIAVASSAQGVGNGHMVVIDPDGNEYSTAGSNLGYIPNRNAELNGPRIGYQPYEVPVLPGQAGIWKVKFMPTRVEGQASKQDAPPGNQKADADWTRTDRDTSYLIAAWDVSVRDINNTKWIRGRVFAPVLNLYVQAGRPGTSGLADDQGTFYGQNYVLTKDGYIYRVDGNGSNGINFFYFVNSSGLLDAEGNPSYKSSNKGIGAAHKKTDIAYHNPNEPDDGEQHVTHKMFYTFPDTLMPSWSTGAVPGDSTWLYRKTQIAEIQNISVLYPEDPGGGKNYITTKGAFVEFETNYEGRYEVIIAPKSGAPFFPKKRYLVNVSDTTDAARVKWDGLDSAGNFLPVGNYPVSISVALVEGEIHFPYFDMEINPQGILIERMNRDATFREYAKVRWDDSAITPGAPGEETNPLVNLEGIRSDINGHKWGTYRRNTRNVPIDTVAADRELYAIYGSSYNGNYGVFSFGNERAMDTWSYAADMQEVVEKNITVMRADLETVRITADKDTIEPEEVVTYRITVRNNGPSDAVGSRFEYNLPAGFFIQQARSLATNCGGVTDIQIVDNTLRSYLDLPTGCTIVYEIKAATGRTAPGSTYGFVPAVAGIVRPPGVTDPDATSLDITRITPGSAVDECRTDCNNIKVNAEVFLLEPFDERGQLALLKTVKHIDVNQSGFQEAGDVLEYTFVIRNTGKVTVSDIAITDSLLDNYSFVPAQSVLLQGEEGVAIQRYTITEADAERKHVENTAIVHGRNPRHFEVKDISGTQFDNDIPTRIDINAKPTFAVIKKIINQGTGERKQFTVGDKMIYQFDIKHEGDMPVEDIQLTDSLISSTSYAVPPHVVDNQILSYRLEYVVTESDVDLGRVVNTATLSGRDQKYGNVLTDISGLTFEDDEPTIVEVARRPKGVPDSYELYQGYTKLMDVLANDDMGSSTFSNHSIEILEQPTRGSVTIENGQLLYVPTDNFTWGEDRLVYRFSDNSRLRSVPAEVKITILRTIPVAVDDRYYVGYNYQFTFKPYENDYVEHSELRRETLRVTSYPAHGELKALGNGAFEYKPHFNYSGFDTFTYVIGDKNGNESAEATVTIEIVGLFFPNTITPNGDGKNDTFHIIGIYKFDQAELEIINRFGQRVFYASEYNNDWVVPENLPEGTYFYIFKGTRGNEKPIVEKGTVLIKRERFKY
ncbi:T9SS type B sorting domain-containing protein [Sphingobacterium sp. SGG-5]|uniref:DUF7507 domain-containing protein n=1 Tax=Sphingobacterium sp. SGG-5 TaxID=2710881 RepID=UPI0013EA63F1|nr:gliding motility-associated C-terminal domain-containing protein [Sphingobacterium sp. SGG-5]NGM62068.1 T9SS type B sorting domain-containing protein [Sphingobacterium sp. SGG-5]